MADEKKPDFVLGDGREIYFDLKQLTLADWRTFINPATADAVEDGILAKVCGLDGEEIPALEMLEWRALTKALLKAVSRPLDDPN